MLLIFKTKYWLNICNVIFHLKVGQIAALSYLVLSNYSVDILKEILFLSTKAKEDHQGSEASLVRLHQLLEDFYANCK